MQSITLIMLALAAIIFWLFVGLVFWRQQRYKAFGAWVAFTPWLAVGCCYGTYCIS